MRNILLLPLLLAAPAAAQELGERTAAPESFLSTLSLAPGQDDLAGLVAAAAAHPLGTAANPVRVGGPTGELGYLSRLRCPDGTPPERGARGDAGIGAFGTVVGAYDLRCGATATRIVFDMYHEEHVEDRAPHGLAIVAR